MTTGNKQGNVGQLWTGFGIQQRREQVPFHVMDGNSRDVESVGECARVSCAGHQCAKQAGAGGIGDKVDISERFARTFKSLLQDMRQTTQMVARGKFGDDAAVDAVQFNLGIDFVGKDTFVCAIQEGRVSEGRA